jgi:hypothetical protein
VAEVELAAGAVAPVRWAGFLLGRRWRAPALWPGRGSQARAAQLMVLFAPTIAALGNMQREQRVERIEGGGHGNHSLAALRGMRFSIRRSAAAFGARSGTTSALPSIRPRRSRTSWVFASRCAVEVVGQEKARCAARYRCAGADSVGRGCPTCEAA